MTCLAALLAVTIGMVPRRLTARRLAETEAKAAAMWDAMRPAEHMVAAALDDFSWREERLRQLHAHADLAFMRANTVRLPLVIGQPR